MSKEQKSLNLSIFTASQLPSILTSSFFKWDVLSDAPLTRLGFFLLFCRSPLNFSVNLHIAFFYAIFCNLFCGSQINFITTTDSINWLYFFTVQSIFQSRYSSNCPFIVLTSFFLINVPSLIFLLNCWGFFIALFTASFGFMCVYRFVQWQSLKNPHIIHSVIHVVVFFCGIFIFFVISQKILSS